MHAVCSPEVYLPDLARACALASVHAGGLVEPLYRLHATRLKLLQAPQQLPQAAIPLLVRWARALSEAVLMIVHVSSRRLRHDVSKGDTLSCCTFCSDGASACSVSAEPAVVSVLFRLLNIRALSIIVMAWKGLFALCMHRYCFDEGRQQEASELLQQCNKAFSPDRVGVSMQRPLFHPERKGSKTSNYTKSLPWACATSSASIALHWQRMQQWISLLNTDSVVHKSAPSSRDEDV